MGSLVFDLSLGIFRLGSFVWELSLNFCLETCAWGVRLATFAGELLLGNSRLGAVAWKLSLGTVAWELALGTFAWKLLLGSICL